MRPVNTFFKRSLCAALLVFCASVSASTAWAQQEGTAQPTPLPTPTETTTAQDEVLRITTELVQTDVMVFDKQGRFIDNLKPEQFELRVDGKPQRISFFERVVAGTLNEETQLAAARGVARRGAPAADTSPARPLDRGRAIFFFVDDLHLSPQSIARTRKTLLNFIDKEMGQNDAVAITSATGQIGFLQQLTDNKNVLRKAVDRLGYRAFIVRDGDTPTMNVYQALEITQNNASVIGYFVEAVLKDTPGLNPQMARTQVETRARRLVQQSDAVNNNLLLSLSSLMRSTAQLPGRKLVFFISDGFVMNIRDSDILDKLRRATDAAARSGTVIYSLDARGLDSGMDASINSFDLYNRLPSASTEIRATQEPLRTLAADTGGRALLNTNALDTSIQKTLQETSVYYLLAWRPDSEQQKPGKFRRIEAKITGRPDLVVRVRSGFFATDPETNAKRGKTTTAATTTAATQPAKPADAELRAALTDVFPRRTLPTSLLVSYTDLPQAGPLLTVNMSVAAEAVELDVKDGRHTGAVEVAGTVLNEEGKSGASFKDQLLVNVAPADLSRTLTSGLAYNYQLRIKPGLYQVRVAARDTKSGRTGSAVQWIEIPDLAKRQLAMSSLLIGGRASSSGGGQETAGDSDAGSVNVSVDRRLPRNSRLRFLTYIYNAAQGTGAAPLPDVAMQVQVFRDDQPVITTAQSKVKLEGVTDMARIPYAAEVPLGTLPAGQYVLQVTVIDRIAKTSATQQIRFEVI